MQFLKLSARWQNQVLALATAMLLFSCSNLEPFSMDENDVALRSSSPSGPTVPAIYFNTGPGGNVECKETGEYEFSSDRVNFNGSFEKSFPDGFTITVTDGKFVSWSYLDPKGKMCLDGISIIVKGGPAANVYTYASGVSGDNNLVSPTNRGGQTPDLSNLTVCYNLKPCETPECFEYKGETAWAAIEPGDKKYNVNRGGNWATYISKYDLPTVKLFAGQNIFVGTATFTSHDMDTYQVNLNLNPDVKLASSSENVKIQDYDKAPSGNPAPGRFDHKFDASSETIFVPKNKFYGFHLDVELKGKKIDCPEE